MKYRELYDRGVGILAGAGIEEAALDARLLLEYVCHTNRNDLLVHGDREVADAHQQSYMEYIRQRESRKPLQYITGHQEFMGMVFEVNEHVLIPRQDTEVLVEEVMRHLHDGMEILDLCTGSGCILLSLLRYSNGCSGSGADISGEALAVARRNGERLGIQGCRFIQSDLFEAVEGRYDIIVSNPPYIPSGVIPSLMEEVRNYEPHAALDGRGDGLFFYREITSRAGRFLKGGGWLFFETGYDQAEAVKAIMEKEGCHDVTVVRDLAGLDRVVFGWK